jgi:hypothetical protein
MAVDKETQKRYVLTVANMKAPTTKELQDRMKELTELYGIHEWRVEKTGLLQFFTQHAEFRGVVPDPRHQVHRAPDRLQQVGPGYGISSMASLFGEYDKAWDDPNGDWRTITEPLIELPRHNQEGMKALVHQLHHLDPRAEPGQGPLRPRDGALVRQHRCP